MKKKKILFSLFLIIVLCTTQVERVHAEAFSLTVAGGSIATGGLAGASFSALLPPVTIIVFAGLIAAGLNVELTEASQAAGMTKTEFVKSKIQEFCQATNKTVGEFCQTIVSGANITKNGLITLTDRASEQIKQLGNWLFDENQVLDNSNSNNNDGSITISGHKFDYYGADKWSVYINGFVGNNPFNSLKLSCKYSNRYVPFAIAYVSTIGGNDALVIISNEIFNSAELYKMWGDDIVSSAGVPSGGIYHRNNYYYTSTNFINGSTFNANDLSTISGSWSSLNNFINSLDGTWNPEMDAPVTDNTFTGNADDWASGSQDLTASPGQTTVLNPGITMPGVESPDITTDVNSYLDAIGRVLDGVQDPAIDGTDDATGLPVSISIPSVTTPELDKENDQDIPQDKTPVTDDSEPAEGNQALEPLTMQLKGVFPFCIPFDVVDMIKLLKAEPVAPYYNVDWHIPLVNTDLEFTVDLSPWNSVAAVCRKMELLAFVIGLAVVTRSMFIRG